MKKSVVFAVLAVCFLIACLPGLALAGDGVFRTLHTGDWVNIGGLVVAVASGIANLTKTDADNKAVGWLSKLVNFFALNFKASGLK